MENVKKIWKTEETVGNIPQRFWEIACECHPDIFDRMKDPDEDDNYLMCEGSGEKNLPTEYKQSDILPPEDDLNRFKEIISLLQNMYENTSCGYPCFEDAKFIHEVFWKKLVDEERDNIIRFLSTEPSISTELEDGSIHNWNWIGGWDTFSLSMCAIYNLSFEIAPK